MKNRSFVESTRKPLDETLISNTVEHESHLSIIKKSQITKKQPN